MSALNFLLVLSQTDLDELSHGIGELPTKRGVPLLNKINGQLAAQTDRTAEFIAEIEDMLAPVKAKLAAPKEPC